MHFRLREAADAGKTFEAAQRALAQARNALEIRLAAEFAYLAVTQAADVAAAYFGRQEPEGMAERATAMRMLDREFGTHTLNALEDVRSMLHEDCFHEGKCAGIQDGFEAAEDLVEAVDKHIGFDQIPAVTKRNSPKKSKRRGRR